MSQKPLPSFWRISPLLMLALLLAPATAQAEKSILVLQVEGIINPVVGNYVKNGIKRAEENNLSAVLIELNTPGGLLDTTREIIEAMVNSNVPVIVYVTPRGARATSAGAFLTIAADISAMSPETQIGAAHPVTIGGGAPAIPLKPAEPEKKKESSVMEEKMVSDAAAFIRGLAKARGRNADWAEKAVRESVSLTAEEAVAQNVVDIVSPSREELLAKLNGRTINKNGKGIVIETAGAATQIFAMNPAQKFLQRLAHPNIAYILMTVGVYGLIYELSAPGIGLGGAVGVICLLLAFFSLQILPVNTVALAIIILGIVMLFLEMVAPSHGLLTLGGLIAFGMGSFFLIDMNKGGFYPRVSIELIISTVAVTAAFFGFVVQKAWAARKAKPQTGEEALAGSIGVAKSDLSPEGEVFVNGELWSARANGEIKKGEEVVVTGHVGNTLSVKRHQEPLK